jgi:osmoprotectant transport system permease protein
LKKIQPYLIVVQAFFTLLLLLSLPAQSQGFIVASKRFTESYILAEVIANSIKDKAQIQVQIKQGMGSTGIVFNALKEGEIDLYPEYWGTLTQEILKTDSKQSLEQINLMLLPMGLKAGYFLGFNNTYALAISSGLAMRLNIHSISDLQAHPNLRMGLSQEFLARQDGWTGLAKAYDLNAFKPAGLEHGLGYQAIESNQIDLMDAYSTDPILANGKMDLLKDDKEYFSSYQAILLYRISAVESDPKILIALSSLKNSLSEQMMQSLNARVEVGRESPAFVAKSYYFSSNSNDSGLPGPKIGTVNHPNTASLFNPLTSFIDSFLNYDFLRLTYQHTILVFASLLCAIFLGIPIGVWVYAKPVSGRYVLGVMGVIQTIPALALLSFLILLVHSIGFLPAFIALLLYALLPIIESTHSGLLLVDPAVKEASKALGAGFLIQLIKIELPLCRPSLLSGIQVAAVWTTGTATIAAFVGAGGYGERIAQGLSTNNTELMLEGALPAALFSLIVRVLISSIGSRGK